MGVFTFGVCAASRGRRSSVTSPRASTGSSVVYMRDLLVGCECRCSSGMQRGGIRALASGSVQMRRSERTGSPWGRNRRGPVAQPARVTRRWERRAVPGRSVPWERAAGCVRTLHCESSWLSSSRDVSRSGTLAGRSSVRQASSQNSRTSGRVASPGPGSLGEAA